MHAQLTTGPAKGPLPTSSIPITLPSNFFSILKLKFDKVGLFIIKKLQHDFLYLLNILYKEKY